MTPYRNLPPLAGICTHAEAAQPGLLIDECVRRLKRFHYALVRMHELLVARITSEPIYELKTAFSYHAHLCAEHIAAIRQRVGEMREPPLRLEVVPHPSMKLFFDEIRNCPTTEEFVYGVYVQAVGELMQEMEAYRRETNPLTDAPTQRLLKFALLELEEIRVFGTQAVSALQVDSAALMHGWVGQVLAPLWSASQSDVPAEQPQKYSLLDYRYDPVPRRDERFVDLWNQGVNAESFLYNDDYPADAKVLMMLYKRIREIDVPEMMASIITQTEGKPWDYYKAMTRQLWDEARHAMMGEVGFTALGVDWTQARITFNWSYRLNTECTPKERHGVLFFIEQGLMPRTGKRYEFEVAQESSFPLAATLQDFDWADEVLHSQIGRSWYVSEFANLQEALDFGDRAWSKILSNWSTVKEQGLTQHENWWPRIYTAACQAWGVTPLPEVLAFSETYEGKRADHKDVSA
jgi:hypothetical protein